MSSGLYERALQIRDERANPIRPELTAIHHEDDEIAIILLPHFLHGQWLVQPETTGFAYRAGAQEYAAKQVTALIDNNHLTLGSKVTIIDIPRGGLPYGAGAAQALRRINSRQIDHVHANTGGTRLEGRDLLPSDINPESTDIIIADGIIGLGTSVNGIIDGLVEKLQPDWSGQIIIQVGSSAEEGIINIKKHFDELQTSGIFTQVKLIFAAGRVLGPTQHKGLGMNGATQTIFLGEGDKGKSAQGQLTDDELRDTYGL